MVANPKECTVSEERENIQKSIYNTKLYVISVLRKIHLNFYVNLNDQHWEGWGETGSSHAADGNVK